MASLPVASGYSSSAYGTESPIPLQAGGSSQPESGMASTNGESAPRRPNGPCGVFVAGFKELPPALVEKPVGLPPGKYKIVGLAMDITGRRLIDEIYFLSAHSYPGKHYNQYIMIHGALNPWARYRHHIRVHTAEFTRILKCVLTRMVIKTKSEYKALLEFFKWLESIKEADEKIILIYHEPRRLTTIMLIQAILRYNLMDTFKSIVAGFCDSFAMCHDKCGMMLTSVSLTMMAKLLLDEEPQIVDIRLDRAKAIHNILEQLAYQESELYDEAVGGEGYEINCIEIEMMKLACDFGRPVDTEIEAFIAMKELIKRQDTFRVVLVPLLINSKEERWQFTKMRRRMAEAGLLYNQVKDAWYDGRRRGVANLLRPLEQIITEEEMKKLVDIFVAHFAPMVEAEPDELFWSSDAEDRSEEDESRNSSSTPSSPPLVGVQRDERTRAARPSGAIVLRHLLSSGVLQIRYNLHAM